MADEPKTLDPVVVTDSTPDAAPSPVAKQPPAMPNFQQMLMDQLNRPTASGGGNPQKALQDTIAGKQAEANLAIENAKRKEATMRPLQEAKEARIGQTEQQQAGISKQLNTPFQVPQETVADFSALGGLVAIMGVMLGTSGKMSAQNVLQSATGILDGYKKGRSDLIAQKQKEFEANMKRLTALSSQVQAELKTYMEKAAVKDQTAALSLETISAVANNGIIAEVVKGQSAFKIQEMYTALANTSNAAKSRELSALQSLYTSTKQIEEKKKEEAAKDRVPVYSSPEGPRNYKGELIPGVPVNATKFTVAPKAGGTGVGANNARYAFQIIESGGQAVQDLLNVAQMPADTVLGSFSGMVGQSGDKIISSLRNTFARNLTSEDARMLQQVVSGVEANISRALGGGYANSSAQGVLKIYEQQVPKEGDSPIVTAMFLARMKQELGILFKNFKNHPGANEGYVNQANEYMGELDQAIPFNVSQVIAATRQDRITNTQQFGSLVQQPSTPPKLPTASTTPSTTPPASTNAAPSSATPPAAYPNAKKGNDGGWYIPDPDRQGKYLKVG